MTSDKFRRQLRHEAQQWQVDGVISPEQFQQLQERYEFDHLDSSARDRFVAILIGVGSVLLGLGIITFVAANWQAIPRNLKLVLLLSVFLGVNISGYWFWQEPLQADNRQRWQHRLGTGLLLLGALTIGANLALGSQLFHIGGDAYELYWVWGLGVLLMAFGLRMVPLAVLSMLLLGLGYWTGLAEPDRWSGLPGLPWIMRGMPLFAGTVFTWLAYRCRSRVIFGMGAIALVSSFFVNIVDLTEQITIDNLPLFGILMTLLPPALLWSYDDALWDRLRRQPISFKRWFRPVAQGLAIAYLVSLVYLASFHWPWTQTVEIMPLTTQLTHLLGDHRWLWLNPVVFLLSLITLGNWIFLARPTPRIPHWRLVQSDLTMALLLLGLAIAPLWHLSIAPIGAAITFLANVVLAIFAAGFIRQGLAQTNRSLFWCGLLLLTLQILSRMLEYETGLLLKSLAFVLCGTGIIVIGLWFERYVRHLNQPSVLAPKSVEETL
ncbi:MAG: DUF2157 domain-containing protein [Cyanobacteria bacterium J06638_20]